MSNIVDAFDRINMPETCEEKIRQRMHRKAQENNKPVRRLYPVAAVLAAVVMILSFGTEVRAAVNQLVVKYFFPDSDITIYEERDENGELVQITGVNTEAPAFARMVNGRLYFLGNGEKIDITDVVTEEEPYYYTFTDDYGLTHHMAVAYNGTIENFGIYEFIREADGAWVTGTGRNFMSAETETRYPWVDIIWAKWDIPWPMPE